MDYRVTRGCPNCNKYSRVSIPEKAIALYISQAIPDVKESYHQNDSLGFFEIDIFLPDHKIGIEYDGEAFHKDVERDREKDRRCQQLGIKLIHVREKKCPEIDSPYVITCESGLNQKFNWTVHEVFQLLNKLTGKQYTADIDVNRDIAKIIAKKYEAVRERSLGNRYPNLAKELHPD